MDNLIVRYLRAFLESKILVILITLAYGLLYFEFKSQFNNDYLKYVSETISPFGVLLTFISLAWIDDARKTIKRYGQKNKRLNVVNLISKVISTNSALNSDLMCDLLAEIQSFAPYVKKAAEKKRDTSGTGNQNDLTEIGIVLDLENKVSSEIHKNILEGNTQKIQDVPMLRMALTFLKAKLENDLTEFENANT